MKGYMFKIALAGVGLALFGASATFAKTPTHPASRQTDKSDHVLRSCDAHKFETVVEELVDGQPHKSTVKLCGKEGQTDAQWIGTLKDAIAKLKLNPQMPEAVKNQIITALNSEIGRLSTIGAFHPQSSQAFNSLGSAGLDSIVPQRRGPSPQSKISEDFPSLPPLSSNSTSGLPPPRRLPSAPPPEYAALPPLPTAPPPQTHVLASASGAPAVYYPTPKMSFTCVTPGIAIEGPCTGFTRDTLLTVHAEEDLPMGTSLRFVRDGDPKAEIALARLKRGRSVQVTVPTDVCKHVVGGKLELRIVRSGEELNSTGPFNLNC